MMGFSWACICAPLVALAEGQGRYTSTHRASLWARPRRNADDPLYLTTSDLLLCMSYFRWLQAFANVEGLFDRLATYVRARLPQIRQVHEKIRDGIKIH